MNVSCSSESSSMISGSNWTCDVRTNGPRDDGADMLVDVGNDGIDHSGRPFLRFRAWNLPSTEATSTIS